MFRYVVFALLVSMIASSCRSTAEFTVVEPGFGSDRTNSRAGDPDERTRVDENPFADSVNGGGIDFRLTRDDIRCTSTNLNTYPDTPFLVAHYVVEGNLGAPCFGDPDERLVQAWQVLTMITPPGQLHDLGVFGGFVSNEPTQTTLAFVNTLVEDPSQYQMSINLDQAGIDPQELRMTMAHEFAHVLTSNPTQIDRTLYPGDCSTWHNHRGCYKEDSLMWAWVQEFWGDGMIGGVDPKLEPSRELGQSRCDINAGFLGPYAASHPEEDFAESFSAFVFRVNADTPELRAKMEWFARQPELVAFRNRSVEAGLEPLRNGFGRCG